MSRLTKSRANGIASSAADISDLDGSSKSFGTWVFGRDGLAIGDFSYNGRYQVWNHLLCRHNDQGENGEVDLPFGRLQKLIHCCYP